jgi:GTP-binding protein LepA
VVKKGDRIRMMQTGGAYQSTGSASSAPPCRTSPSLAPGEIGFLTASIKQVRDTRVGDTITHERSPADTALPGFKPSVPVVFCGLFPVDTNDFEDLRDAIEKLALNDASPSPSRWKPPPPSASASAAASSGFCTSRSSATGSNANTIST